MQIIDKVMNHVEMYVTTTTRIPRVLRGGIYRSRLLNSMAHSPSILQLVRLSSYSIFFCPEHANNLLLMIG